jgi:hypothetical protein
MCAVRGLLPRPAVALAWCDGNIEGDLDSWVQQQQQQPNGPTISSNHAAAADAGANGIAAAADAGANGIAAAAAAGANGIAAAAAAAAGGGEVDVAAAGYCEVLAVLLSDGQLAFFRSVESDLWEETLEDQVALGGPKEYLIPLGFSPTAAAAAAAGGSSGSNGALENDAEYYGGLSVPTGPWSKHYGSAVTAVSTQGGDVQRLQFPPLSAAAGSSSSSSSSFDIPLAEGRAVLSLVWLGQQRLLLLAAPLEDGLEDGKGTVLIEVSVTLPASLPAAAAAAAAAAEGADGSSMQQCVEAESVCVSYAGGWVLTAASHPAGGAVLQLTDGKLMYYPHSSSSGGGGGGGSPLLPLPAAASFPCSCPLMLMLPHAPHPTAAARAAGSSDCGSSGSSDAARQAAVRVAAAAPAVGLSVSGVLYWGSRVVAADVYSVAVRGGGPGGPALLYVTRQSLLYVLMIGQLPRYQHSLVSDMREVPELVFVSFVSLWTGALSTQWYQTVCVSANQCAQGFATAAFPGACSGALNKQRSCIQGAACKELCLRGLVLGYARRCHHMTTHTSDAFYMLWQLPPPPQKK